MKNFHDVTGYLYSLRNRGARLGTGRIMRLVKALGSPQDSFDSIAIGGTSGKGSTAIMVSSILKNGGFRVGTFTSPHLSDLTERIKADGKDISKQELSEIILKIRETAESPDASLEPPTFFEAITAAAFLHFRNRGVDYAVLEVGLGGRLDATRASKPLLSIITNVSLEHTRILGSTVEKIAYEKGGIIEPGGTLVTAATGKSLKVLEGICRERNAKIIRVGKEVLLHRTGAGPEGQEFSLRLPRASYESLKTPLLGEHQVVNAACAVAAVAELKVGMPGIKETALRKGLAEAKWPGRMEIVKKHPLVLLDAAKDPEAIACLRRTLESDFPRKRTITVLSISSDKNIDAMVRGLAPVTETFVIARHRTMERAADPRVIAEKIRKHGGRCRTVPEVKKAVAEAVKLAGKEGMVVVTGSLFTVAEARELFQEKNAEWGREFNELSPRQEVFKD
ncbi:bifunctional folylpolyglutamate synthase/dihydrofolate synthase [Candidatus Micrarchaeota archaeon]|nr:bifunctional folylpolyglutamate synthase/dihydrofolate synthase [Candidatus Micrarchaeota archaeon]